MAFVSTSQHSLFKRIDWKFIAIIFALNVFGLFILYSATHGAHSSGLSKRFVSQIIWLSFGWTIFFSVTLIDYKFFRRFAWAFYFLNLGALILVPLIGKSFYGAKRWLDLGFMRYQPSETMKIALFLVLARVLSKLSKPEGLGFKDILLPLFITFIPFVLIAKQPDLGTAMMLLFICLTLLFFVRLRLSVIITAVVGGLLAITLAWNFALKDYQKSRVKTFLSPGSDPRGAGYNSIQSKIAVGSGMFRGKGYLKGTQSQLEFLPERHTDFIFSVLSEEFGFVGSAFVLSLFAALYLLGIRSAMVARDKFGALIAIGGISYIFWHQFVNIAMVIGLLPIVGVPLPLLSYGGSGVIATMTSLGLASSVAFRKNLF